MADDVDSLLGALAERRIIQRKEEAAAAAAAIQKTENDKITREQNIKSWEIGSALISNYLLKIDAGLKAAEIEIASQPLAPIQNGKEIARHSIRFKPGSKNVDTDLSAYIEVMDDGKGVVAIKKSKAMVAHKTLTFNVRDFNEEHIADIVKYMLNIGMEFAP